MQSSGLDGRIPVFVFPQSLEFYVADHKTHKQVLTLYNPYDFCIFFSVLCNNPVSYDVEPSAGRVFSKCSLNIIVTRSNLSLFEARERDCIRIAIHEEGNNKLILGKKDIQASLHPGCPPSADAGSDDINFQSVRGQVWQGALDSQDHFGGRTHQQQQPFGTGHAQPGPSLLLVAGAVVCLVGLLLPTVGEEEPTMVPLYMHLSTNIKIVLAYALGLLTYAILKPM